LIVVVAPAIAIIVVAVVAPAIAVPRTVARTPILAVVTPALPIVAIAIVTVVAILVVVTAGARSGVVLGRLARGELGQAGFPLGHDRPRRGVLANGVLVHRDRGEHRGVIATLRRRGRLGEQAADVLARDPLAFPGLGRGIVERLAPDVLGQERGGHAGRLGVAGLHRGLARHRGGAGVGP